jgi:fusion and transport protein UGO1
MAYTNRDGGVNPLRPYSVPGAYAPPAPSVAAAPTPSPTPFMTPHRPSAAAPSPPSSSGAHAAAGRYASKARDMLQDLDYDGYLGGSSSDGSSGVAAAVRGVRAVTDDLMWKYTSVLMAQPFEMAKAVLQVRCAEEAYDAAASAAATAAPETPASSQSKVERTREDEDLDPFGGPTEGREMLDADGNAIAMGSSLYDMGDSSQIWSVRRACGHPGQHPLPC